MASSLVQTAAFQLTAPYTQREVWITSAANGGLHTAQSTAQAYTQQGFCITSTVLQTADGRLHTAVIPCYFYSRYTETANLTDSGLHTDHSRNFHIASVS
jgi:hypothetical protein